MIAMDTIIRNPVQDELQEILEMLCTAFGEGPRERFRRQIWEDSTFDLNQIRIAEVDGKIVSHVWVAKRPIFFRGQTVLPMGGIGAVGTVPEFRKRGLATSLLQNAIAYMKENGYLISMLFTGINSFYARLGWADFPQWQIRLKVRRIPEMTEIPENYKVRPYNFERDLPMVQDIYFRHIQTMQISLPHARPENFWQNGHPQYLGLQPNYVVTTKQQEIVAYACTSSTEQGLKLNEFAFDLNHPLSLQALSVVLAKDAVSDNKEGIIEAVTPWLHPLAQTLTTVSDGTIWHQITEHMMIRVINLKDCLESAQPMMEFDLHGAMVGAGLPCLYQSFCFQLTQPEQAVTIVVERGSVTVKETDEAQVKLPVTPREFCLLYFGAGPAHQWRYFLRQKGINLNCEQVALLSLLFPPHSSVYWSGDHF